MDQHFLMLSCLQLAVFCLTPFSCELESQMAISVVCYCIVRPVSTKVAERGKGSGELCLVPKSSDKFCSSVY